MSGLWFQAWPKTRSVISLAQGECMRWEIQHIFPAQMLRQGT